VLLSLALFVVTSMMLLSIVGDSIDRLRRSRDLLTAADHARSALSLIESGLARPETLHGAIEAGWGRGDEDAVDPSMIGFDPDDAPGGAWAGPPTWALEIETEATAIPGLTLVSVRAYRIDADGSELEGEAEFTLRQLVRLSGADEAAFTEARR
jgi:hypothetical protein